MFKGGKYFDKHITPKCDYCQFGKRSKAGNKVLCEKRGMVDCNFSCSKFIYSPLKRIPVKQLNFVGSLADEDIYIESAGDRAEKELPDDTAAKAEKNKAEAVKVDQTSKTPANETSAKPEVNDVEAAPEAPDEPVIQYSEYKPPTNN